MVSRQTVKYAVAMMFALAIIFFILFGLLVISIACAAQSAQPTADTLKMESYSVVYRPDLRIPVSVDWPLTASFLGYSKRVPSWRFAEDTRVPRPRATHDDYNHSGYDRGHMCPAGDRTARVQLMRSTFVMTNVCPQAPRLNRGDWKSMENACRAYARNGVPVKVHVDAVFWNADTQRIGRNQVAVPHGFVKTVYSYAGDSIINAQYFQNW